MSVGISTSKTALIAVAAVFSVGPASPAQAGPLCDWLFGRSSAPAYPSHVANYPVAAVPVTYQAPATYQANYPVQPAPTAYGYTANYPAYAPANGAAALQMPGYSSYYGTAAAPNDRGYAAYTAPVNNSYPASGIPLTSYYGTGNVYPDTTANYSNYSSYYAPAAVAPVTAYQAPVPVQAPVVTGAPPAGSTIQTYPGVPAARPGVLGGVSRFFGSLFGTRYSSSYNRVPVTYYRPVTTLDAGGQPVVTQQACTSYQYQLQRAPFTSFAPAVPAAAPANGCTTAYNPYAGYAANTYVAPAYSGGAYVPSNPAAASSGVVPSTYYGAPATTPSNPAGSSYDSSPYGAGYDATDQAPVGQPSLSPSTVPSSGETQARPPVEIYPQTRTLSPTSAADRPLSAPAFQSDRLTEVGTGRPQTSAPVGGETNPHVRPLPANDYPHPSAANQPASAPGLSAPSYSEPRHSEPRRSTPSVNDSGDRVANANWGYKPIEWGVQLASHTQQSADQRDMRTDAPPITAPSISFDDVVDDQQAASPRPQPESSRSTRAKSRRSYDSLGWSSKPKR